MSEVDAVNANSAANEESNQNAKGKQKKSPRVSTIDRTREESEAITKGLGPEVEGRRRTRSAVKGVTATPPPPAKKEKKTPNTTPTGKSKGRGRPKKVTEDSNSTDDSKDAPTAEGDDEKKPDEKDSITENSHKDETANNNADTLKESSEEATENGAKEDSTDTQTSESKSEDETKPEESSAPAIDGSDKPAE